MFQHGWITFTVNFAVFIACMYCGKDFSRSAGILEGARKSLIIRASQTNPRRRLYTWIQNLSVAVI